MHDPALEVHDEKSKGLVRERGGVAEVTGVMISMR